MPQPRERKSQQEDQPAPDAGAVEQNPTQDKAERDTRRDTGRTQPDRYADRVSPTRDEQPDYPEQNPPGRSERPDAVEGAEPSTTERESPDRNPA